MAKPTDEAKNIIISNLEKIFEGNTILYDKKLYIDVPVGQDLVQIALTLTAPKNPITIETSTNNSSYNIDEIENSVDKLMDLINF